MQFYVMLLSDFQQTRGKPSRDSYHCLNINLGIFKRNSQGLADFHNFFLLSLAVANTNSPPTMPPPFCHPEASQHGRDDVLGVHRGWNRFLLHKLLLLLARYHFTNQKWKMWFWDNSTVVTQKNICIILFVNLHKKWNADQHAILKRPLIISLFSNSCQEHPMCP